MISTSHVVATARAVRITAMLVAVGLLVGFVAISSFWSHYGSATTTVVETRSNDTALATAVLEQEDAGLVCSEKPVLTDVVLFQPDGVDEVMVLTFDQAIKASSAREGWIRSYCATP